MSNHFWHLVYDCLDLALNLADLKAYWKKNKNNNNDNNNKKGLIYSA